MSTNLEIEFKSALTKEDYLKLLSRFDAKKIYKQTNYYIDTKNRDVVKNRCGLRIRFEKGQYELTLKVPAREGKTEINVQISDISFKNYLNHGLFPKGEIETYLSNNLNIKIADLSILGKLENERLDIAYQTSLISIDKSEYNSVTDYEIECEDQDMESAERNLIDFLRKNQIEYKKSPGGKLKRFLRSLDN